MQFKTLDQPSVICQSSDCGQVATLLIVCSTLHHSTEKQVMIACCEYHRAEIIASVRLRYDLHPLSAAAAS